MKKGSLLMVLLLVLALVAALTCPPQAAHEVAMKETVRLALQEAQIAAKAEGSSGGMLSGYLGQMLGQLMAKQMMKAGLMSYHSFGVFSTSEVNWDGKTYPVGVGVFGHVFISDKVRQKILTGIETAKQTMQELGQ